ncbi:MAG: hypothetical protein EAX96_05540 [Candidatus Lokiarchaeota archaeon]|nr:hypothetical protein [Candidatus Lokiarchaeota archaeon]
MVGGITKMEYKPLKSPFKTILSGLKDSVDKNPDKIAITFSSRNEEYTYKDLCQKILKFANGLRDLDIKKGDFIGIILDNCPEFIIGFYGSLLIGAISCTMIKILRPAEIVDISKKAKFRALIISEDKQDSLEPILKSTPSLQHVISVSEEGIPNTSRFWDIVDLSSSIPIKVDIKPNDWATINFTSGTTGRPKGTIHTHQNYLYAALAQKEAAKIESGDSIVLTLPMYHIFGLSIVNSFLLSGAHINMLPKFLVQDCLKKLCDNKTTMFAAVPSMYSILCDLHNIKDFIGSFSPKIKTFISGGAPLSLNLIRRMENTFIDTNNRKIPICEAFGTTEDTAYGTINPWYGKIKHGSVGVPMPGGRILCVDDEGNPIPLGVRGEIVVQNPGIMMGYFKLPKETRKVLKRVKGEKGIWLYTGDIGIIDKEGYVFIVDRKKDLIIVGGQPVVPRDVEEILIKKPEISEVAVIGQPHAKMGETVRALIVLKKGSKLTADAIKKWASEQMADFKVPRAIEFTDYLKKNISGQVLKSEYRPSFEQIRGD